MYFCHQSSSGILFSKQHSYVDCYGNCTLSCSNDCLWRALHLFVLCFVTPSFWPKCLHCTLSTSQCDFKQTIMMLSCATWVTWSRPFLCSPPFLEHFVRWKGILKLLATHHFLIECKAFSITSVMAKALHSNAFSITLRHPQKGVLFFVVVVLFFQIGAVSGSGVMHRQVICSINHCNS